MRGLMMSGSPRRRIAIVILAVALGVRALGAVWWQQRLGDARALGMPDSYSYWELGQRIAAGRAYEFGGPDFRIFRTPGYPALLAGLFVMAGQDLPVLWARLIGAALGVLVVGAVMWLGRLLFDGDVGLAAGALVAVYPGAVAMSVFVLSEALFCPLMVAQLSAWICAWRATTKGSEVGWALAAGAAAGLAVLTRPSWLLFIPFVLACLFTLSPSRWRHLRIGLWMIAALSVVMSPWWIRNYQVAGRWVSTTLQVGASLYDGLNPEATGASDMRFAPQYYWVQKRADAALGRSSEGFEARLDERLGHDARAWARTHPDDVARLAGCKLLRMWNVWPNASEFRSWPLRLIVAAGYVPVLVLGGVGLWRWGRRGWPYALCFLPAVYFTCLHMVFVSSIRYRDPAILVWMVLPGAVLMEWVRSSRRGPSPAASVG
jgi:4-amino-4-deoxy-L-arabinose transferase-like glycosyltransferase